MDKDMETETGTDFDTGHRYRHGQGYRQGHGYRHGRGHYHWAWKLDKRHHEKQNWAETCW
jgi:hypothetical protein